MVEVHRFGLSTSCEIPIAAAPYTAEHIIKQVAALPYRIEPDGAARILLITSRETRRWIIPKGNPIRGLEAHQAAAREAFEEAGISGIACPAAIGQDRSEEHHYELQSIK